MTDVFGKGQVVKYPPGCNLSEREAWQLFNEQSVFTKSISLNTFRKYRRDGIGKFKLPHVVDFRGYVYYNKEEFLKFIEDNLLPKKINYESA